MPDGPPWRSATLRRLATEAFDLAVIGGGITGAGIAREAALRGLRVALLEARDFASGTSSRSSRLIHGGVRYLEHGHLALVFEASRERRILLRMAPHLVRPLAFTWPVYRGARISRLRLALGLGLYDTLSLFRNVARHERLSRDRLLAREPALRRDGLAGGATYWDAATDDARLTLANVIDAAEHGAAVLNHAPVSGVEVVAGRARGVAGHDAITGDPYLVTAATIVNATGPWTDDLRALEAPIGPSSVRGSRGAHIAIPRDRVGNRDAVTMLHPADGRVLFALPAGDQAIVGTTEVPSGARERDVRASDGEVDYLLEAANAYFPAAALTRADVIAAWAGIRPLAAPLAGDDVGSASREHTILRGPRGVVHVTGGKLTTYRAMAEQVVDAIDQRDGQGRTRTAPLPGGETSLEAVLAEVRAAIGDRRARERLALSHGTRWRDVWTPTRERPALAAPVSDAHSLTGAEVVHAVDREMACTLGDVLLRRSHAAFELPDQGRGMARAAADLMAPRLGWSAAERDAAVAAYGDEVSSVFGRETGGDG